MYSLLPFPYKSIIAPEAPLDELKSGHSLSISSILREKVVAKILDGIRFLLPTPFGMGPALVSVCTACSNVASDYPVQEPAWDLPPGQGTNQDKARSFGFGIHPAAGTINREGYADGT